MSRACRGSSTILFSNSWHGQFGISGGISMSKRRVEFRDWAEMVERLYLAFEKLPLKALTMEQA
jgi:hypothetical protein